MARQSDRPNRGAATPPVRRGRGLALSIRAATGRAFVPFLRRHLRRAHRLAGSRLRELSLAIVGDRTMASLHGRFMGERRPTDVLSFALESDGRGRAIAGEVVVCLPQAVREARRRGLDVRRELLLYALHGVLHLCGFDDRTEGDYQEMHRMEDRILKRLGLGAVFEAPDRAERGRGAGAGGLRQRGSRCS